MAQAKKNIARWVLQGICVLGILLGASWVCVAINMLFVIHRDDPYDLWVTLALSGLILLIGAWLARDCYRMLRRRSFGGIKSISAIVALLSMGFVGRWLMDLRAEAENRLVHDLAGLAPLLFVVLVYFGCKKLLNRLRKTAYGPEESAETPDSAG